MATRRNYLLGYGERLNEPVTLSRNPSAKATPYTLEDALSRLSPMVSRALDQFAALPEDARPHGEVVAALTLHPEYLAKTYYPGQLLRSLDLRPVGSRARTVTPEKRSKERVPEPATTTEIFVAGLPENIRLLSRPAVLDVRATEQLVSLEEIRAVPARQRVKPIQSGQGRVPLEVVLHASEWPEERYIVEAFQAFAEKRRLEVDIEKALYAGGLCFLRTRARAEQAEDLAEFAFLRVVREMPRLRVLTPILRSARQTARPFTLPETQPIDSSLRVAIFDGGLSANSPLRRWAKSYDGDGVGNATPELLWHGDTVTSALLFGSADLAPSRPSCHVDHYRVLDDASCRDPFELYDVLQRIDLVLAQRPYEFISLSIGPTLPIDDDEVHAWTSVLDDRLASGKSLLAIAAGNTGGEPDDPVLQRWRVQVPGDCVNALTVGAADSRKRAWRRAPYSSRGPGRSPGLVKPDVLDFGGADDEPFWVLDPESASRLVPAAGTSYAAPGALRGGVGVRAHFGAVLTPLAIKTLLIHCTERSDYPAAEVGWGRLPQDLEDLTVCKDGTVRVVYQDEIAPARSKRIRIPLPDGELTGKVNLRATFCFSSLVEPGHAGSYTRGGLTVAFRPNATKFDKSDSVHAVAESFFAPGRMYQVEQELRADAHKWETTLHRARTIVGKRLVKPVFDIHYHARTELHKDLAAPVIKYALVLSIEAPKVRDLYDQVVRAYRAKLQALTPVIEVPLRT